ncbi:C45 family autoproteolytic acyltransferase/hydolase [Bacillus testis]|uniref:C45 family autoproteolytic acyltransferase/hydolase n=1 Tax=Bacillus testis TaxID=1622072 RepID=UPI00067EBEFE|nr:C45 family peptidase [Bacillus testis]
MNGFFATLDILRWQHKEIPMERIMEMEPLTVDIVQMRASLYEIGIRTGSLLKGKAVLDAYSQLLEDSLDAEEIKHVYKAFAPHLLEELEGLAEGTGFSVEKSLKLFGGYGLKKLPIMGCTAFMTAKSYVRNYDFSPALYDSLFSVIQHNKGFASAGYNQQGIGRLDGVNECGLAVGLHFVSFNGYKKGLSAWNTVRILLECCKSVEEAILLLQELPHAACYNFSLSDQKGAAVAETCPEQIVIRQESRELGCFNMFESAEMKHRNKAGNDSSQCRKEFVETFKNSGMSTEECFRLFADLQKPLFFQEYTELFGTLHTIAYDRETSCFMTALAQAEDTFIFSMDDWKGGCDFSEARLAGMIEERENTT